MNINELFLVLEKYNIHPSNREIATIWGMDEASFSRKKKSGSAIKQKNILQIEEQYRISITSNNSNAYNSGERQNDITIPQKAERFGHRMAELQDKHEYLDKDMAKLLHISEEEYIDIKLGNEEPDYKTLIRLKQLFKISLDWLLFGE